MRGSRRFPSSRAASWSILLILAGASTMSAFGDVAPTALRPGVLGHGVTLLPNGWRIAPAGRHVQVGDLPLAMVESPDGRLLLIENNGYATPTITIVDREHEYVRETVTLDHAWLGMAWHPDGKRLYVSGAGNNTVHEMHLAGGKLTRGVDLVLGRPMEPPAWAPNRPEAVPQSFVGGLAVSPDGSLLFAVHVLGQIISVVDLESGHVLRSISLPAEPYTCVVSPDGSTLFVSIWGGAKVLLFDTKTFASVGDIAVGEHPNAMVLTKDGSRLFVACANTNAVWAIDVAARHVTEQIRVSMFPNAPSGSTPNHVSVSPDGRRLLVANADNNTVAVVDISTAGHSELEGFVPTGWYPTAAMFSGDGHTMYVLSGKGLVSAPNPRFRRRELAGGQAQYIGSMLTGTLSILPAPDADALRTLTAMAYRVASYSDEHRLAPAGAPAASPIPARVGGRSPITHVFYVIRENRSYDQVFGDLERGDNDPTLCLFCGDVTPNAHALAREFGVLDNFYVDAEVSYDGHAFSTAAYATDLVEKFWPTNYAARGAAYLSEGGGAMRNAYGNIAAAADGYIWDSCVRANVSVRSYGEFAAHESVRSADGTATKGPIVATVPGLRGRVSATYPPYDLTIPDQLRADAWLEEFRDDEARGSVPALSIIRLGNDHTSATRPGSPTPRAMVADNDLALGRIVEAISKSRIWGQSAIFVVEDDAQNGPDHVDAHRSIVLTISPFSRRRGLDSTLYTTSGVLRTMELILGLPPMSQYDASATPLYNAFQATPSASPFSHVDARVPLDEKNAEDAYGADASKHFDLAEADRVPDALMNEILWRSIRGAGAPLPAIVRSGWIRRAAAADNDDR
ncbi:MAG TPA: SMP-30/gluconolactonase/LRE family protein [Vicinamibacterales bacterium]|nr:SMP-30/gluconolactonase/LRE family protein [Vicinamibacterales bacterium]